MKITQTKAAIKQLKVDMLTLVVPAADLGGRTAKRQGRRNGDLDFKALDDLLGGRLKKEIVRAGFKGDDGNLCIQKCLQAGIPSTLLFLGLGKKDPKSAFERINRYRLLGAQIAAQAAQAKAAKVALATKGLLLREDDLAVAFLEGLYLQQYTFTRYKSKTKAKSHAIKELLLVGSETISSGARKVARALVDGTVLARDLVNMPAADCSPAYLASQCRKLGRTSGLRATIYDRARLKKLGAGSLLSVSQGSSQPPYLAKLVYSPGKKKKRKVIALVGKGVTFDSGGLSIKVGGGMQTMKCDMAGAAAVIGAMQAISQLKPNVEVRAYVPTTENMINGKATRPGDVVKAISGKTIEILNTDAEGRLILADALCLAEKEGADTIIDLATLTGAVVVALGNDYAGLFTDSDALSEKLQNGAVTAGERVWRLPLAGEYRSHIKSKVADIRNIGAGSMGGSITAALFLQEFVDKATWAHLDIAGPAFTDGDRDHIRAGGTGFGVRTLVHYVMSLRS